MLILIVIYLLTAIGLTPGGSSTVHIYTQTIHRTTQNKQYSEQQQLIWEQCGPCPVFASYTLAFALQLRKRHGKTSVRVRVHRHSDGHPLFFYPLLCSASKIIARYSSINTNGREAKFHTLFPRHYYVVSRHVYVSPI
jgi:hypothetical protein